MLVAADRLAGGPVDVGQPVDSTPDQDRVHRRGRHGEPVADLDRPEPLLPAQVHDLAGHRRRSAVRLAVRRGGTVDHPGRAFGGVAVGPLLRCAPRDVVALGRAGRRPAVIDDQAREPESGAWGQGSVGMGSVGHEGLLDGERFLRQLHSTPGGLHPSMTSDRVVAGPRPKTSDRVVAGPRPTCLGITPRTGP